jgi:chromosomal replication initiator protein
VVEPKLNRFLPLNQNNEHVIAFRSWQLAEEMGKEYTPREFRKSVDDIILEVLVNYPGITIDDIKGERRTICIMIPRHKAMYEVCRQRPDLSFPQIGLRFGGRDHTTILSAVRKMGAIYGEVR